MQTKEIIWQERIKLWEGLANFKNVLIELLSNDINKLSQASLDMLFPGYEFKMQINRKRFLLEEIDKQLKNLIPGSDLYLEIQNQKNQVELLDDEIIIRKETQDFKYEYVLKNRNKMVNLFGFVKIINKKNKKHRALLSWQSDRRDPILFLAELVPDNSLDPTKEKIYFHINLGQNDGLAVIEETEDGYRWTHSLESEYAELINAEFGSVIMDKQTKYIKLEDGNIPAAMALTKAEKINTDGVTVLENNIALMQMYKTDLQNLDFDY
jgi:hypothetical protein